VKRDNAIRDPDLLPGVGCSAETHAIGFPPGLRSSGIVVDPWDHPPSCQKLTSSISGLEKTGKPLIVGDADPAVHGGRPR
jgi:hypothetical protein